MKIAKDGVKSSVKIGRSLDKNNMSTSKTTNHETRQKANKPKRKKLIIKRSEWARGRGYRPIYLLDVGGMKCCLGFLALSCKISKRLIKNVGYPSSVRSGRWPEWLVANRGSDLQTDSCASMTLTKINDDSDHSSQKRERLIREEMAKHGVDVKFVP